MAVRTIAQGDLDILTLDHGKVHAIDPAFIEALTGALDAAERSASRAAVLTGAGKVFCAGLDLVWTAKQDRAGMEAFVSAFEAMFEKVFFFPKPIVAAVNGAAFAGGAILALACDARVFAPGQSFALNEVLLGIPFPTSAFEIARQALPRIAQEEALLAGATFSSERCAELGLGRVTGGDVVAEAAEVARRLSRGSPGAVAAVKADLAAPVRERIAQSPERRVRFLEHWFAPETRARIEARLAERRAKTQA
jgi:enoyl-CoA hydratase